ncbi:Heat shock protein 70 family [Penicillium angulare]|uniref:Heat shock protein 70 family n=1 Tax=Penicillium angulare TaxID=116970 RepID=A0A9W9KT03_9EURO|nr:Heat shock protein 70 family [Penicillium angulare]
MTDSDVEELSVSPSAPSGQAKFFLGFDFGTTHSGIAYAFENCPEDLEVIQEWPEGGNNSSQKVPTLISFRGDTALWGYMVNEMKPCIRGFKLLLDKSKNLSYGPAIESEAIIQSLDKKPVDIAGIYLKKLMSHARTILCRRGIESVLDTMDVQYIVTVPAVWSDKAKDLTMQAARLAGIPQANLVLLSEPEAAAVDAIRTIQPNSITQDDCFIVCDAGGGTVDLITYKVTQKDPLRLEEVTEGTGAICGSTILDNAFQKLLIETISKTHYDQLSDEAKRIPMRIWEKDIKPNYAGQDLEDADADDFLDAGYIIPVPGVPDCPEKHIRNGMLYFESEQVEKIFRPVVEQIKSLISDQVLGAKLAGIPPKAVILVGGLGSSEYVFKALKTCFTGMEVMQPRNA